MPIVRATQNRPARALLDKAKELVQTPYLRAAANYVRQAFEMGVRTACELKKIEMRYCIDPKAHQAQDFLDKLKTWPGFGYRAESGLECSDCTAGNVEERGDSSLFTSERTEHSEVGG